MTRSLLALLSLVALVACSSCQKPNPPAPAPSPSPNPTAPPPPPPPDPTPPATPEAACANLAAIGCSEGTANNCSTVMQHALDSHITKVPTDCLAHAPDKAAAKACGFVECK